MLRTHLVPALLFFILAAGLPGHSLAADDSLEIAKAVSGALHGQRQANNNPPTGAAAAALADLALLPQPAQPAPPVLTGSAADNALADLAQNAGGRPRMEPANPAVSDHAYLERVVQAIAGNWDGQSYRGRDLSARIRVDLNAQGLILSSTVLEPSGNSAFDSAALYAVLRTAQLPQPPDAAHQGLFIYFNPLGLSAGI